MIFVWKEVFQDNDLHIVLGNASLQQRSIFEDRVVLTVTAIVEERFKRIAPMIRNAPLHLVTDRADGEVRSSVDQAHTCPDASPSALRAYVDQSLRGDRAGRASTASRNHREILSHRGLDLVPFFRQLARVDRLGFYTEQLSGLLIIARRPRRRRGRRVRSIFDE